MSKIKLLTLILLLSGLGLWAQNDSTESKAHQFVEQAFQRLDTLSDEPEVAPLLDTVEKLSKRYQWPDLQVRSAIMRANFFDLLGEIDPLSNWLSQANQRWDKFAAQIVSHEIRSDLRVRLDCVEGLYHERIGNYTAALRNFQASEIEGRTATDRNTRSISFFACRWEADIVGRQERNQEAVDIEWRCMGEYEKYLFDSSSMDDRALVYNSLGYYYIKEGNLHEARRCLVQAQRIIEKDLKNLPNWIKYLRPRAHSIYGNLVRLHLSSDYGQDSVLYFLSQLRAFTPQNSRSSAWVAHYRLEAETYQHLGDTIRAHQCFERELAAAQTADANIPNAWFDLAKFRQRYQHNLPDALAACQEGLRTLIRDNPNDTGLDPSALEAVGDRKMLLDLLLLKSRLLLDLAAQQPSYVEPARATAAFALEALDLARLRTPSDLDRQQLLERRYIAYEHQLEALSLGPVPISPEAALAIMERCKGLSLLEQWTDHDAAIVAQMPDVERDQLYQRRKAYAEAQEKIRLSALPIHDSLYVNRAAADKALREYQQELDARYPDYNRLRHQLPITNFDLLRRHVLDPKTALIEYFVGDSSIYVICLTSTSSHIYHFARPTTLDADLIGLQMMLADRNPVPSKSDSIETQFVQRAGILYDLLLAKPLADLPKSISRLVIVPDGNLGIVPFEVLGRAVEKEKSYYHSFPYLVRRYAISYVTSASLLAEQSRQKTFLPSSGTFAGFAPTYSGSEVLPMAQSLVLKACQLFNGNAYLAKEANERKFRAEKSTVLLLCMHAKFNQDNPLASHLSFAIPAQNGASEFDNELTFNEICALRLSSTRLVVLSACETGKGGLRRGEGQLSLSRAFAYAGTPATVVSLWDSGDLVSGPLLIGSSGFFPGLKTGLRKDEALQQAKLAYLERASGSNANPRFWAMFISVGDQGSIIK